MRYAGKIYDGKYDHRLPQPKENYRGIPERFEHRLSARLNQRKEAAAEAVEKNYSAPLLLLLRSLWLIIIWKKTRF